MSDQIREDQAEHAFWQFDARRKGYAEWRGAPQSERDAFKAEYRQALGARPDAASPATASGDERAMFEAWIKSHAGYPFAGTFTNLMWDSLQARAAVSADIEPATDEAEQIIKYEVTPTGPVLSVSYAAHPATASGDELPEQWHERTEKMDDASIIAAMKSEIAELRAAVSAATKPAPLDIDKLERFDHRGAMMAPDPTGDYLLVSDVRSLLATKPAAPTDASLYADEATRLRHVVTLLGIQHQVPGNDAALRDCLFSVLGLIARKLEVRATKPAAAQAVPEDRIKLRDEALSAAEYLADCNYEDAVNRGKGGPGVEAKVGRAEARVVAAINALAAAPIAQEQAKAEPATVTLSGHQLREALGFINPDGDGDRDQLDDDLTFGIVQHRDDNGCVATGMCCWNDHTDGVLPLDSEYSAPMASTDAVIEAKPDLEQLMMEKRIELVPEYEGEWRANVYRDSDEPLATAAGPTPSAAVAAALKRTPAAGVEGAA